MKHFSESFDEIYETIPGNGWLSKNEAELLWQAANDNQGPILEVGSYQGRSTVLLAATMKQIYAVDPFDDTFDDTNSGDELFIKFHDNLRSRNINNVLHYRCRIEDWKKRPVGFAYLDGDHTFVGSIFQIKIAKECGAKQVCIHDCEGFEIKRAIEECHLKVLSLVERMAYCEYPNNLS